MLPSQEKLAQIIVKFAKIEIVLFHFQLYFTHSMFDNCAPRRQKLLQHFSKAKQMPNWRVHPGFLVMGHDNQDPDHIKQG
jgi:hypothetical protein